MPKSDRGLKNGTAKHVYGHYRAFAVIRTAFFVVGTEEIQECVNIIKGDDFITHEIECEKLKARYEHLYASFRVKIKVNSSDMKRALELFMANSSWPNGIFVRRYFPPKEQDGK